MALIAVFLLGCKSSKYLFSKGKLKQKDVFDLTIPVHIQGNLMIVTLQIEGKDYRFLFDTGSPMVVDKALREKFAMKTITQKQVGDSQGKIKRLDYVKMPPFKLAGLEAQNVVAIEADLKSTPGIYCLNLDGIIGANFMKLGFWEINPRDSTLRFTNDFERISLDGLSSVVPFRIKSTRTPVVNVRLNGTTLPYVTFDTGSAGVLSIPSKKVEEGYDDSLSVFSVGYHSGGLFGSRLDSTYQRQFRFGFGHDSLPDLPLEIDHPGSKMLLGMGYLKHYRTILNWESQKIYLERLRPFQAHKVTRFGISPFLQDSVITVGVVSPSLLGPGPEPQPELGDTIVKVNDLSLEKANHDVYCQVVREFRSSDTLQVTIKNKGERVFTRQQLFPKKPGQPQKKLQTL